MAHVLLIGSYAPSIIGFRGKLIESLINLGHKVSACATDSSKEDLTELASMGVAYYDIPLERRGLNPLKDIAYTWRLFRLFRSLEIDVVLGYTIKPVIYGSIAARLAGVPYIASMITGLGYSFFADTRPAKILRLVAIQLFRISLHFNEVVFFQNLDDMELFKRLGLVGGNTRPVRIQGSGVDIDHFVQVHLPANMTFLMIGRLTKEKGVLEYLKAAEIIKKEYPGARFVLLGDSFPGSSYLSEQEMREYTEKGVVSYLGTLKDVRPVIAECKVFVLPSHGGEGIPRSILEALAMGRPIITTDTPGCRETVIEGTNGRIVPPRSTSALVETMRRFLEGHEDILNMGNRSREMAVKKFNVNLVNRIIIENLKLK